MVKTQNVDISRTIIKPKLKGVSRRVSTRVTVGGAIEIDIEKQSIRGGGTPRKIG